MLFLNIHHWRQLVKISKKKKLYLIVRIDFKSEILAMFGIKVMIKLGSVTHQVKLKDRLGDTRKHKKYEKGLASCHGPITSLKK